MHPGNGIDQLLRRFLADDLLGAQRVNISEIARAAEHQRPRDADNHQRRHEVDGTHAIEIDIEHDIRRKLPLNTGGVDIADAERPLPSAGASSSRHRASALPCAWPDVEHIGTLSAAGISSLA